MFCHRASIRWRRAETGHITPPDQDFSVTDRLVIRGAREHNLKDVSIDLPRDSLIVFTGLSGSGKSSLAFDTIFAEGQRRYVESLSAYARQFLGQMDKPDVDFIEGLSPGSPSTRSPPRATPDPRSAPSPRSTTTCACSTPAPAGRTARSAGSRSPSRRRSRSSTASSPCRPMPASRCWRRSSAGARGSTASCSASCRRRASAAPWSTASRTTSPTSRPSWPSRRSTRSTSSSTGSRSRRR